jgi:hypothetical protein
MPGRVLPASFYGILSAMDETRVRQLQVEIAELEQVLADKKRQLEEALCAGSISEPPSHPCLPIPGYHDINNHSSPEDKIALFRSLFRGREDVFAKRLNQHEDKQKRIQRGYALFALRH